MKRGKIDQATVDRVQRLLSDHVEDSDLKLKEIAGRLGVRPSALTQFLNGTRSNMTIGKLGLIALAMNCEVRIELVPKR